MLYPLELNDGQVDKSIGDKSKGDNVISQEAGHSEDKSVRSLKLVSRTRLIFSFCVGSGKKESGNIVSRDLCSHPEKILG